MCGGGGETIFTHPMRVKEGVGCSDEVEAEIGDVGYRLILGAQDFYQSLQIGGYQKEVLRWRGGSIVEII